MVGDHIKKDHDAWVECHFRDLNDKKVTAVVVKENYVNLYTDCGFVFGIFTDGSRIEIAYMSEDDHLIRQ